MTAVGARFAGGPVVVGVGTFLDVPMVDLELPGSVTVPLFPDEARRLAVVLIEHAAKVERKAARRAATA